LINQLLTTADNRLTRLMSESGSPADWVDALYWSTLSRGPSPVEQELAVKSLQSAADKRIALEDLAWALLNSHEFMLRR
jgi:hypothetical protein